MYLVSIRRDSQLRAGRPLRADAFLRVGILLICFLGAGSLALAQTVTQLILIDADSDQDIAVLGNGDVIDLATVGTSLNIRAEVSGAPDRVLFALDQNNNFRNEAQPPYALAGDDIGDYNSWTPTLGSHTVRATPFVGTTAGTALEISFFVVEDDTPPPPPGDETITALPN